METLQRTTEWYKKREGRVTASSVGSILGIAPYSTKYDVMRRMVREYHGQESEFNGNVATEYGTYNEAGALIEFEIETGLKVENAPFVISDKYEWLGASPDGYVSDGNLIEIKCPYGLRNGGHFKSINEQKHYYAQMQLQMFCTNKKGCYFYQWQPKKTMTEFVEFNEDYFNDMFIKLEEFYKEYLVEREFPNARNYLDNEDIKLDDMVNKYLDLKKLKDNIEEEMKQILNGLVVLTDETPTVINGHKLYKTERAGSIAYSQVVKEHLKDIDLEPYRGKSSTFWSIK